MKNLIRVLTILLSGVACSSAADIESQADSEAAIRDSVRKYIAAFNAGDAKALAELWSPEAVYLNPLSGEQVTGRSAIEQQFTGIFAESQGAKLDSQTKSIEFLSPNVAVEQGTAVVLRADEKPDSSEYTAVYVKRDGQWLLDRVTERDVPVIQSNYDHLKELEWMVGTWIDDDDSVRIETTCSWTKNRNFMTRSFMISAGDTIDLAGMQFIGWDPTTKQIRSWVFDSNGGFGEGVWSQKGNAWYVRTTDTTAAGKMSAVNIITPVDNDTFTWQSINRESDGKLLPNINEVTVVRQTAE